MRNSKRLLLIALATVLGAWPLAAGHGGPVTRRGTSVLHYMTRNTLVTNDAGSNVVGTLRLQFNEQGRSQKQSLRVEARGLDPGSTYGLIAVVGDDTNTVPVMTFIPDGRGRVRLDFMSKTQGRGGRHPVPDVLTPLTDVRSLGIENSSTQTLAYAWIADAHQFQFIVKRNLTPEDTNGTAAGSISLIANQRHVNFRLLAGGLGVTNDYHLALNSNIVDTVQADNDGRLLIRTWPADAPAVLALRSLSLLDGTSNVVLHTRLPQ